jgi:hypothetical protein
MVCEDWFHPPCVMTTIEEARETNPWRCPQCSGEEVQEGAEGAVGAEGAERAEGVEGAEGVPKLYCVCKQPYDVNQVGLPGRNLCFFWCHYISKG